MGVKSSDDRTYNHGLKHDSEVIKKQSDQRRDRMLAKQQAAQAELVEIEERAKVILGKHGVPTYTCLGGNLRPAPLTSALGNCV